ncbi:unnamed protein product, partial [Prorocentrum cordatum]
RPPSRRRHGRAAALPPAAMPSRKPRGACPLCAEAYDRTDLSFDPCVCSYRVCLLCVHRLREEGQGCPGCRRPYDQELQQRQAAGNPCAAGGRGVAGSVTKVTAGAGATRPPAPPCPETTAGPPRGSHGTATRQPRDRGPGSPDVARAWPPASAPSTQALQSAGGQGELETSAFKVGVR